MKKTAFIFILCFLTISGQAALPPETLPYPDIKDREDNLWFHVQNGSLVVTKAIMLDEDGEFICAVDTRGRSEFVPGFTVAADSLFVSSLGNIPKEETCNSFGEQQLVEMLKAYTPPQEVQVAGGPLLLLVPPATQAAATAARVLPAIIRTATVLGSGCAIGLATELTNNHLVSGTVFGSAMGTIMNMWPGSVTLSRILKGMGLGGAASIACDEGINYILEPQVVENVKEMFPIRY